MIRVSLQLARDINKYYVSRLQRIRIAKLVGCGVCSMEVLGSDLKHLTLGPSGLDTISLYKRELRFRYSRENQSKRSLVTTH